MTTTTPKPQAKAAYLQVLRATGATGRAADAVGLSRTSITNWRAEDQEFAKATKAARQEWEDSIGEKAVEFALGIAFEGLEENVISMGRQGYVMEIDPDAVDGRDRPVRKLRLKLDENGEAIPLKTKKRNDKLLERVLERYSGWAQEATSRAPVGKEVILCLEGSEKFSFLETLQRSIQAQDEAKEAPRIIDAIPTHGRHDHNDGSGGGAGLPDGNQGA